MAAVDVYPPPMQQEASYSGEVAAFDSRSLATEVLPLSNLIAQQGADNEGGSYYTFPVEDAYEVEDGEVFELNRDDTFRLIGVLNSHEIDIANRELSGLLGRLERPAVEGLTRRLFTALRRRKEEMTALEHEAKVRASRKASAVSRGPHSPGAKPQSRRDPQRLAAGGATEEVQSPTRRQGNSPRQEAQRAAPRGGVRSGGRSRSLEGGPMGQTPPAERRSGGGPSGGMTPRTPRVENEAMPQVFRRLTGPEGSAAGRPSISSVDSSAGPTGGIMHGDAGPEASAYLEAVLEAHEQETGHPATSSRRSPSEEIDPNARRSPRVPEEKAREIFDRLYKSGKEHKTRRRVYHEVGLLVEQAKLDQTCTFEPAVPRAGYPGGAAPDGSVSERLYRESIDRRQRREERALQTPAFPFRPRISSQMGSFSRRGGGEMGLSPRDTLDQVDREACGVLGTVGELDDNEDGMAPDLDECDIEDGSHLAYEPPHIRLFREHEERQARQKQRQDLQADWRKHPFRPNITPSQASGPQVVRSFSASGLPPEPPRDTYNEEYDDDYDMQAGGAVLVPPPLQYVPSKAPSPVRREVLAAHAAHVAAAAAAAAPSTAPSQGLSTGRVTASTSRASLGEEEEEHSLSAHRSAQHSTQHSVHSLHSVRSTGGFSQGGFSQGGFSQGGFSQGYPIAGDAEDLTGTPIAPLGPGFDASSVPVAQSSEDSGAIGVLRSSDGGEAGPEPDSEGAVALQSVVAQLVRQEAAMAPWIPAGPPCGAGPCPGPIVMAPEGNAGDALAVAMATGPVATAPGTTAGCDGGGYVPYVIPPHQGRLPPGPVAVATQQGLIPGLAVAPMGSLTDHGYVSREVSAATFNSGACVTPSHSPPVRHFSGRIPGVGHTRTASGACIFSPRTGESPPMLPSDGSSVLMPSSQSTVSLAAAALGTTPVRFGVGSPPPARQTLPGVVHGGAVVQLGPQSPRAPQPPPQPQATAPSSAAPSPAVPSPAAPSSVATSTPAAAPGPPPARMAVLPGSAGMVGALVSAWPGSGNTTTFMPTTTMGTSSPPTARSTFGAAGPWVLPPAQQRLVAMPPASPRLAEHRIVGAAPSHVQMAMLPGAPAPGAFQGAAEPLIIAGGTPVPASMRL